MAEPSAAVDTDSWRHVFLAWRGRVSRRTFWIYGVGGLLLVALYLQAVLGIAGMAHGRAESMVNLILLYPALAVSAKRWQDRGRSPWWVLVVLIPVIGWIWALVDNGLVRGTRGPNRFGPEPDHPRSA